MENIKARLHSADHILCTLLEKYGAKTKAMEFKTDSVRITFECETDLREIKEEIENKVNEVISSGSEVINYKLPRNEAEKVADISMVPESVKEITIYEIKGFNKVACGGPHVDNTSEIGKFQIIKIKKKGKNIFSLNYAVESS